MRMKIAELAKIFQIEGELVSVEQIGNGNVNQTYDVYIKSGDKNRRYVFQKVNSFVFKNPEQMMKNIDAITKHIAEKLDANCESRDCVMHFVHRRNGKNYYNDVQGFWRVSEYVPNAVTYNTCDDLDKLRAAGKAFGHFQTQLSDFDASSLYETIPKFHNTRSRIDVFIRHINEDPCGRADEIFSEIEKIKSYRTLAIKLNELVDSQELPLRVTHNDTKINNVLFDASTGEAKTVIDLDTVMPGLLAHDFGDAVRFACNSAAEDEADVSKVALDMDKFRAFAEGFIPEVVSALTPMEMETLVLGVFVMTVELAVRFLDDYITGDMYFKTLYKGHNLVRGRSQLALADDIYKKQDDMNTIVARIAKMTLN